MKEMKISKLFHWLYAFLMLVPVAIFGANTIYYGFNDKAEAQEYTKAEPVYYDTNEVNSYSDLVIGNVYTLDFTVVVPTHVTLFCDEAFIISYSGVSNATFINDYYPGARFENYLSGGSYRIQYVEKSETATSGTYYYTYFYPCVFDVVFSSIQTFSDTVFIDFIKPCARNYIKSYEDVTYTMGIADSLVNSLDHTFDLPMFKWTRESVVYTAFNGLSVFAGLGENSIFACFLTYWLDISLIWLAFDMLMFLPMWAHSMLDKKKGW